MRRPDNRLSLLVFVAAGAALLMAGCGAGYGYVEAAGYYDEPYYYDDPCCYYGSVDVDNYSPEFVDSFFLAPAATDLWTAELLGWPLAPGEASYVGDYEAGWYDAESDLEFGDLVQWLDVELLAEDVTTFEVY